MEDCVKDMKSINSPDWFTFYPWIRTDCERVIYFSCFQWDPLWNCFLLNWFLIIFFFLIELRVIVRNRKVIVCEWERERTHREPIYSSSRVLPSVILIRVEPRTLYFIKLCEWFQYNYLENTLWMKLPSRTQRNNWKINSRKIPYMHNRFYVQFQDFWKYVWNTFDIGFKQIIEDKLKPFSMKKM